MQPLKFAAILFVALHIGMPSGAGAQTYPLRPVRIIVGWPPGGGADVLGRIMAPRLSQKWGEQAVIDNRPGAGGRIGSEVVTKSPPDGYTLLLITLSHAVEAGLYRKLPYHPVDSFTAISLLGATPIVLLAHPSLPVKTAGDLIKLAKARPGKLSYGSSGIGGTPHLAGELFKVVAGINIVHVPYKGSGLTFIDLIGGQIELAMSALPGAVPHIRSGKVRALAVTSAKRSSAVPEVPTVAESVLPGFDVQHWYGLLGPAGMSNTLTKRIHDDAVAVLGMQDVADAFLNAGTDVVTSEPKEFENFLRAEVARWSKIIRDAGVQAQ